MNYHNLNVHVRKLKGKTGIIHHSITFFFIFFLFLVVVDDLLIVSKQIYLASNGELWFLRVAFLFSWEELKLALSFPHWSCQIVAHCFLITSEFAKYCNMLQNSNFPRHLLSSHAIHRQLSAFLSRYYVQGHSQDLLKLLDSDDQSQPWTEC